MRALIVAEPHLAKILDGLKIWERRKKRTNIRERIGLIRKGSGLIVGTADLVDCVALPEKEMKKHRQEHCDPPEEFGNSGKIEFAWVLQNAKRFPEPISYKHPSGAQIWVSVAELPRIYRVLKNGKTIETLKPGKYVGNRPRKIFGRLDCESGRRLMKKENRVFFISRKDAIGAGYRPCKKCKPMPKGRS